MAKVEAATAAPFGLLAEPTHRCPCCSNPLELARASADLDTATWGRTAAADPACALSPDHARLDLAVRETLSAPNIFTYREIGRPAAAAAGSRG